MGRDVFCPVAFDESMEQVREYIILDFSIWEDNSKFGNTFHKLIDGFGLSCDG